MARTWLRRIAELDPVTDHQEIYRISAGCEFPFDYQRALEFALFRTYCVPSISALLAATGEFEKRPQQRYDDTALLMTEIAEHGYDSERGKQALRVINRAHGRYVISNDDMLYVLSTFVYDPVDWIDRFGWRRLHPHERDAAFHYFQAVGKRMGIKDIPPTFAEFRRFKADYEREHFRYSDTNHAVGRYTMDLFCSWFPKPLRPAVGLGVRALLDEPMLTAFGFRAAPAWVGVAARGGLKARSAVVRLLPERRISKLTQDPKSRTYPNYPHGYTPEDLGAPPPPSDLDPKWLRRSCPFPAPSEQTS
ncbi:oxygenase MpaB family protein [Saccharopolyspora sp. NPDC047091]|uniref:oxygenase MpaB family protein n=1 Tax=Saccharopolyspora sp. NPDC047091 TaxID=3155924 RepID=UPI0033CB7EC3